MLRLIIPFIVGILISVRLDVTIAEYFFYILAILILLGGYMYGALFSFRTRWIYGVIIIFFLFLTANLYVQKREKARIESMSMTPQKPCVFLAIIDKPFELRERSCKGTLEVLAYKDSIAWKECRVKAMIYTEPDSVLSLIPSGSYIIIHARLEEVRAPLNPEEFDYKTYLSHNGIYHSAYLKKGQWQISRREADPDIFQYASKYRVQLLDKLSENGVKGSEFGISAALLLGDNSKLEADIRDAYARAGAMHILCVSGLHVGVVFLVLTTVFGFLKRFRAGRFILPFILILSIWFYALITGLAPPVLRASCMLSFIIVGRGLRRQTNVYNTLATAAFLMLLMEPYILFSAGFQLSFSAVLGIVALHKPIYKLLYFRYRIPDRIWAITAMSLAAQLGTLPLVLSYFHQFPVYGLLTNLIVIPLSSFIIYCGAIIFLFPSGSITMLVAQILKFLIRIMDKGVAVIESLPYAVIPDISLDERKAILLYLIIIGFCGFLILKRRPMLILGLCSILVFSAYRTFVNHNILRQENIIIYAVNRHTSIDIVHGNRNIFMADSILLMSPQILNYSIKPNWLKLGFKETEYVDLGTSGNNFRDPGKIQILPVEKHRAAVWSGNLPNARISPKLSLDLLILRGNFRDSISGLLSFFEADMIILDGSIPPWDWQRINEEGKRKMEKGNSVKIWDVREDGAFVLNY